MATPLAADQTVAALRKWGVRYREVEGWRTRNRSPRPWGPVYGFLVHHTGDDLADDVDRRVIVNGRPDLPGPLAQFGLNDDGVVDLIGCGRANHAGGGSPAVLAALQSESYGDYPPATHHHDGSPGAVDGNAHLYGCETYYSGSKAPLQYRAMVLLVAAITDAHGWSEKSAAGHKEWSDWKPDPGSVDMKTFRADVAWCHAKGPAAAAAWCYGTPTPATPASPEKEEDPLMGITANDIAEAVWDDYLLTLPDGSRARPRQVLVQLRTSLTDQAGRVAGLTKALELVGAGKDIDLAVITEAARVGTEQAIAEIAAKAAVVEQAAKA